MFFSRNYFRRFKMNYFGIETKLKVIKKQSLRETGLIHKLIIKPSSTLVLNFF
ncbi:hypothetical protein AEQU3_03341 [Aequorivita antarctica]|nr:hypothetical protein AEQU3_03341 [Aequorivita antarctica]